jgi:hypothetical protein
MATVLHASINEWITAGRSWVKDRALRSDIALICVSPHLFECKRPSAAWCARQHGVSREYAAGSAGNLRLSLAIISNVAASIS